MPLNPDHKLVNRPNRTTPKTKRLFSTSNSVLDELRLQTVEKFQTDTYGGKTEWYGVVLQEPTADAGSDFTKVRVRIPEVHAHLPVPKNSMDSDIIDLYPEYLGPKTLSDLQAGVIVRVTHQDKNHAQFRYENGVILEATTEKSAFAAGYSSTGELKDLALLGLLLLTASLSLGVTMQKV